MRSAVVALSAALFLSSSAFADTITVTSPVGQSSTSGAYAPDTWYANNVKNGGAVGITNTYADHGNGSIQYTGPANAKADLEYYFSPANSFALTSLTSFSYDVYRSSTSTAEAWDVPALRLYVTDGSGHSGYLIYEPIYNETAGSRTSPTNAFVSYNTINDDFWTSSATLGNPGDAFNVYNRNLAGWNSIDPNLRVYGFSVGIGSGWNGSFDGAVDNISYGVNGTTTNFNFETPSTVSPTPEPSSLLLLGSGLVTSAGMWLRRRRTLSV